MSAYTSYMSAEDADDAMLDFYEQQQARMAKKHEGAEARKLVRRFTATDATVWTALHATGTPIQRLADTLLSSRTNPAGGGAVVVPFERLAASLGIETSEVQAVVSHLPHHDCKSSKVGDANMPMRAETSDLITEFAHGEGRDINWKINNAPVRYQVRYAPVVGNPAATFAMVMLAATQSHKSATKIYMTEAEFAAKVGISTEDIADILPILIEREWIVGRSRAGMSFRPSPELLAIWAEFQSAACEPIKEAFINVGGFRSWRVVVNSGARETAYEIAWREANGLAPLTTRVGADFTELDIIPVEGGWNLYRMSDAISGKSYIGLTGRACRSRLREHIERQGSDVSGGEHNNDMAAWIQLLTSEGREPEMELLRTVGTMTRHQAEAKEHRLVLKEVKARGGANVLNIEHHPEKPLYAFLCKGHKGM